MSCIAVAILAAPDHAGPATTSGTALVINCNRVEPEALDRDRFIGRCFHNGADKNALLVEEGLAWDYRHFSDDYVDSWSHHIPSTATDKGR